MGVQWFPLRNQLCARSLSKHESGMHFSSGCQLQFDGRREFVGSATHFPLGNCVCYVCIYKYIYNNKLKNFFQCRTIFLSLIRPWFQWISTNNREQRQIKPTQCSCEGELNVIVKESIKIYICEWNFMANLFGERNWLVGVHERFTRRPLKSVGRP